MMKIFSILKWILFIFICMSLLIALFLGFANYRVAQYKNFTTGDINQIQKSHACLVLGTSKYLVGGGKNLYYEYRINAAVKLFNAGKCEKLVVSGDNRYVSYNEPEEMKNSLISNGIAAENIFCDYAGGRTLDSVLRFDAIFGQSSGIVVSQEFHNTRAIYIARAKGIELVGFNAQDVDAYYGFKTNLREILSKGMAFIDINILDTKAHHYGDKISI